MSTEKLDQYLKDPMSMPEFADLEHFEEGEPAATEAKPEGDSIGATPGTDGAQAKPDTPKPDTEAAAKPVEGQESDQSVVKSKDGKHEIPYSVLATERENRIRAERMAQELTEKITSLEQAKASGEALKAEDIDGLVDRQALEELREESPAVAETIDKLVSTAKALQQEASSARELANKSQREDAIQRQVTVEEAITAIPKLAHVRTNDPEAFNAIAAIDAVLRAQPNWQDKPMQQRFEAAVRMHEAANGNIELPGAKAPEKLPDEVVDKKVEEAVKKAESTATGPNTLSDIPGGGLPATNELGSVEDMSGAALTAKLAGMTEAQQEEFLARLTT